MPEKHHFVPRFYFRFFSKDGTTIEMITLPEGTHRTVHFSSQAQENHLYGRDSGIEGAMSKLEGKYAPILKKMVEECALPQNEEEYYFTLNFLSVQHDRTAQRKDDMKAALKLYEEQLVKPVMKGSTELKDKGITEADIDSCTLVWERAHSYAMLVSQTHCGLLADLIPVIVINETDQEFIFSDSPVVYYNQFFNVQGMRMSGIASSGLIVFCPLSPKICYMLYDKKYYSVEHQGNILKLHESKDIENINSLQIVNCDDVIYFSEATSASALAKQCQFLADSRREKAEIIYHPPRKKSDGTIGQLVQFKGPGTNYQPTFSFIANKTVPPPYPLARDEDAVKEAQAFLDEEMKKGLEEKTSENSVTLAWSGTNPVL